MSKFLNQDQIWDLAKQFRYLDQDLTEIGNQIDDEIYCEVVK